MKKKHYTHGFTLIEVIVVIAIISTLFAMIIPSMVGFVRKSRRTADLSAARTVSKEMLSIIYNDDDVFKDMFFNSSSIGHNSGPSYSIKGKDGAQYNIIPFAMIGGKDSSSVNKSKWVCTDPDIQGFCDQINSSMHLGYNLCIEMKYDPKPPAGQSIKADTWAICYVPSMDELEIWVGQSSGSTSFTPMYCVYPYVSEDY